MTVSAIVAAFAAATVSADADVTGVVGELAKMRRAEELRAEFAALSAAERAAEDSGDKSAWYDAMCARDAWEERTESERITLFGRSGWWR